MSDINKLIIEKSKKLITLNNLEYSEENLRDISVLLRFLFIENLDQVYKLSKKKFNIKILGQGKSDIGNAKFYQSGGGNINGISVKDINIYDRVLTEDEIKKLYHEGMKKEDLPITKYFIQTGFIHDGIDIKKQDVIKFVANKLGGIHYDTSRSKKYKSNQKYIILDKIMSEVKIAGENPIYVELKSITQEICESPYFKELK